VQVCTMYGAATVKEPGVRAIQDSWVEGWHKLTGHPVQLWEYQLWPTLKMPFQYPHVLQKFYQQHRDALVGSFLNGVDGPSGVVGEQYAQFGPTMYCWFRLLWNPDFNVDAAIAEYVEQLYGPAQAPMGAIVRQLIDRWENVRWEEGYLLNEGYLNKVTPNEIYEESMPPGEIAKLKANLAQARALAPKGSVYERRVNLMAGAIDPFVAEADAYYKTQTNQRLRQVTVKLVNNANRVPGRFGKAYKFDAVSLLCLGRTGFSDQAGTFECWILGGTNGTTGGEIFNATEVGGKSGHRIWRDQALWTYATWGGTRTNRVQVRSELPGGWHHLMAAWQAASGTMALYLDGVPCGQAPYRATAAAKMPVVLGGGAPYAMTTAVFAPWSWGAIDEVRLSNIARRPVAGGPVAPFKRDANTMVLLHFDEEGKAPPKSE